MMKKFVSQRILIGLIFFILIFFTYKYFYEHIVNVKNKDDSKSWIFISNSGYFELPTFNAFNGEFIKEYSNGNIKFIDQIEDGKRNGLRQFFSKEGFLEAEIPFVDNLPDGNVTRWYKNGRVKVKGQFKQGKKVGIWKEWYPNQQIKRVMQFSANGEKDGVFQKFDNNGKLIELSNYAGGKKL